MSKPRYIFMLVLLIACIGLGLWLLAAAALAGKLTGQVFFALLPLVMLGSIAVRALTGNRDG